MKYQDILYSVLFKVFLFKGNYPDFYFNSHTFMGHGYPRDIELYSYNEEDLFNLFKEKEDKELKSLIYNFENVPKEEIPRTELQNVKMRKLNPIVDGKRI